MWLLLCLWMWGILFDEFQRLPVDDCPAASCDSGVLARGSEREHVLLLHHLGSSPKVELLILSFVKLKKNIYKEQFLF